MQEKQTRREKMQQARMEEKAQAQENDAPRNTKRKDYRTSERRRVSGKQENADGHKTKGNEKRAFRTL